MKKTSIAIVTLFSTLSVAVMSYPAYAGHGGTPSFVACSCGNGDGGTAGATDAGDKVGDVEPAKDGEIGEQQ